MSYVRHRSSRWLPSLTSGLCASWPLLLSCCLAALDYLYERLLLEGFLRASLVGPGPFFDPSEFPHLRILQDNFEEILREVVALRGALKLPLLQDVEPTQEWEAEGRWETLILKVYNVEIPDNMSRLPTLQKLLWSLRRTVPTAMISVLRPGGHIRPHYGYYNGVLRYHLGLMVPPAPEPPLRLGIRVGHRYASWRQGQPMMFDDCYEHEVWNQSDGERIVLFLDVVRPLPGIYAVVNSLFILAMQWHPTVLAYKRRASITQHNGTPSAQRSGQE
mmetsp:Transcript_9238/g.22901  ORF Transcript_9238/g.22901 Transcript_9238/m.22901 type:complete len:275 (-) Transcript_9238:104-928(-)